MNNDNNNFGFEKWYTELADFSSCHVKSVVDQRGCTVKCLKTHHYWNAVVSGFCVRFSNFNTDK